MTTTTSYGTWNNRVENYSTGLDQTVFEALGDFANDYDLDALAKDYRDAINNALPDGVTLCGDEFIGPAYQTDASFDIEALDIKAAVDTVDFWAIAAKHDKTA